MKQSVYDYSFEMKRARNRRFSVTFGLVITVVVFLTLVLNFILFPVFVRSESMDSDIPKNSALFFTPLSRTPERGDVVYLSELDGVKLGAGKSFVNKVCKFFTFQQFYPFGYTSRMSGKSVVRRVVALPGDTIYIKDYVAYVKPADSDIFLTEFELAKKNYNVHIYSIPVEWDGLGSIGNIQQRKLGKDEYFVLADNRIEGSDSRLWGTVSSENIKGTAVLQYFPFKKFKFF